MSKVAELCDLVGRNVLVVEDEYYLADDLSHALKRMGARVIGPVPTGAEAMRLLEAESVDLAVLDINLRGEMAFALADDLLGRGVPFVFATGYDRAQVPGRFGHVPRWEKPFDPETLVATLPGVLPGRDRR